LAGAADHEAAIRRFAGAEFPQAWVPLMARQMAAAQPSRISRMALVSHLAVPELGVALVGDAGARREAAQRARWARDCAAHHRLCRRACSSPQTQASQPP
jgi:hypothetical protein